MIRSLRLALTAVFGWAVLVAAPVAVPSEAETPAQKPDAGAEARAILMQAEERPGACVADPKVLEDLTARKAALDKREAEFKAREEEFKAKETALQEQLAKLEDMRKSLIQTKLELTEKQSQQVAKLVETLERMSPKASAKVMGEVEEDLAVEAMTRMSTEKLAKVLANLDPAKSSRLSERMALGRASERTPAQQPVPAPQAAGASGNKEIKR